MTNHVELSYNDYLKRKAEDDKRFELAMIRAKGRYDEYFSPEKATARLNRELDLGDPELYDERDELPRKDEPNQNHE